MSVRGRAPSLSLPRMRGRVAVGVPRVRGWKSFIISTGRLALCCLLVSAVHAQQAPGLRHVSVIGPGFEADSEEAKAFRESLRNAGYVEGRDLSIDWWYGQGRYDGVSR